MSSSSSIPKRPTSSSMSETTSTPPPTSTSYQHLDSSGVVEYASYGGVEDVGAPSSSSLVDEEEDLRQSSPASPAWWQQAAAWMGRSQQPVRRVPLVQPPPPMYAAPQHKQDAKGQPLLFRPSRQASSWMSYEGPPMSTSCRVSRSTRMAAIFLRDYEHGRAPTLQPATVTDRALWVHDVRFSTAWKMIRMGAVLLWFVACGWEGDNSTTNTYACVANGLALAAFLMDMGLRHFVGLPPEPLRNPMLAFMTASSLELICRIVLPSVSSRFWITSAFKPVALFYISEKARQAYLAIARITPIVSRVLALELLLILSFAAVACRLYAQYESFATLAQSWLSLFQLSTTVVNPSMWMPMYEDSRTAAFFFIPFDIATTLYLHSLVLSIVFQTYIQASTEVFDLSMEHREETLRLSFEALRGKSARDAEQVDAVPTVKSKSVRRVLERLRPHYSALKINALMEIYNNGSDYAALDYQQYRHRIQQVMNASIRAAPTKSPLAYVVEIVAAFVAIVNLVYVVMLSSAFQADWFDRFTIPIGYIITMLGLMELVVRVDPFHVLHFTPMTKLNPTFDGIAALAAATSLYGLIHYKYRVELLLTGRAIDMVRIMRFQKIFRDVIRRSGEIMPALVGPFSMLVATNHFFVYVGMALWGGAIEVGTYENITPRYDLNNFNSYWEGMVTMFNVLIVNDWHAISEVFTYASRNAEPYIVYPFFVAGNLISVSIMLNCATAFFVGAFVAKLEEEDTEESNEIRVVRQRAKQFSIDTSNRSLRRIYSSGLSASSRSTSMDPDVVEFDVYERPTFDKIMKTVSGGDTEDEVSAYAKDICDKIKTFEALSPVSGRKLGFLIVSQQPVHRFGNLRFETMAEDFMEASQVPMVANAMHAQLLEPENRDVGSVTKTFENVEMETLLTIKASLIRQSPPVSMLVASVSSP